MCVILQGTHAFVIGMSSGWIPDWGGLLHFISPEKNQVYKTLSPGFNTLSVFRIIDASPRDHFVSQVCGAGRRLSFTVSSLACTLLNFSIIYFIEPTFFL
jgi:Rps23 Pro-64 3,4-dihydroxylase Tpa1-like proline 4-hydroxylase